MLAVVLIVLGVILTPVVVIFVWGFIKGWREYQPPPPVPLRTLWYELVWGPKPRPKPRQRFRVLWPPSNEKDAS